VATEPLAHDNADIVMDPENAGDNPQRYVGDHMNTLVLRTEDCFNQEKEIDIVTYFETSRVAGEISGEYIEEEVILSEYPAWYGSGEKMLCPISIWGKKREGGIETISRTNQKYTILETNIVNVYADNYLGEEYWECQDNRYIRPYLLGKIKDENLNKYDCEYFLPVVDYSTNKLGLLAVGRNPTYPYFNNSNIVYMNNCIRAFVSGDNSSFFLDLANDGRPLYAVYWSGSSEISYGSLPSRIQKITIDQCDNFSLNEDILLGEVDGEMAIIKYKNKNFGYYSIKKTDFAIIRYFKYYNFYNHPRKGYYLHDPDDTRKIGRLMLTDFDFEDLPEDYIVSDFVGDSLSRMRSEYSGKAWIKWYNTTDLTNYCYYTRPKTMPRKDFSYV